MSYRTFEPNLTIAGQKINPLSDIMNLGIQTTGNVVFVKHPSDADYRTVREAIGRENVYDTIQQAIDSPKVRNGKNDFVVVCPRDNNASWVATGTPAGINLNKHNVHLIGLGAGKSFGSASVVVEQPGTAGTIGTMGILQVTGNSCEVAGFHFLGTAGTSTGGTMGDGGNGGVITIGAGVNGFDLHDFRVEKTGIQWDAGTTGVTGTPAGDILVGSASKNITIRDGAIIGTGLTASASHGINLLFNNTDIRIKNVEIIQNKDAAAGRLISVAPGTVSNGLQFVVDRCKLINTSGTVVSSAVGGTMGVGFNAMILETASVGATQAGTAGSIQIAPVYGTATVIRNPYMGIGTAALGPV